MCERGAACVSENDPKGVRKWVATLTSGAPIFDGGTFSMSLIQF